MPNTPKASKPRKLLQVGTPIKLSSLVTLLGALDPANADEAIVDVYNGQLRVTEPQPTLDVD